MENVTLQNEAGWAGASLGGDGSDRLTLRVTSDEKERLEQLRRVHGLTSKAQVIRAALDLLERVAVAGVALGVAGEKGVHWRQSVGDMHAGADAIRARHGVPVAPVPAPPDGIGGDGKQGANNA